MNKLFLIFAITLCYFICTISCIERGCYTLEIDSLELVTGKFVKADRNNYYYLEPTLPESTNELGFAISASEYHKICEQSKGISFPFISQAFADEPISEYTTSIDLITITSNNSITIGDELFVPNSSLNELFEASLYNNFSELNDFLSSNYSFHQGDQINIRLSQIPDHPLNQQFFFKVIMSDGTIFELESDKVQTN